MRTTPRLAKVDFGDTPEVQLEQVSVFIRDARDDALRCETGLKVTDDITKCRIFAQHFESDSGKFIPALLKLKELSGDADFYRDHADIFTAREQDIADVRRVQQMVLDKSR